MSLNNELTKAYYFFIMPSVIHRKYSWRSCGWFWLGNLCFFLL